MNKANIFDQLVIPETLAAGPGPGNTDSRVLERFAAAGVADHMHPAVLQGMIECKFMLRDIWGTNNVHTFAIAGTGWSGLDSIFSAVLPGDTVVAFVNGTFSSIDALTLRLKASTLDDLAKNSLAPEPANVVIIDVPHGQSVNKDVIDAALSEHKPKWAFMAHWETGSGRINDLQAFSDSCEQHGTMGLIDAVSSFGVADFSIDDYPGVAAWASCPQKGICALPLTYAPVSFTDKYIEALKANGAYSYVHHPIFEARHWGIVDGQDVEKGTYHRTHSGYAVSSFHEALRLTLIEGLTNRAKAYEIHEAALKMALQAMGCDVTSNMTSLVVLDLPSDLAGREMELVQACRAENFGIWPTLSEPIQVRVGILNQLTEAQITEIVSRFMDAFTAMGGQADREDILAKLNQYYRNL